MTGEETDEVKATLGDVAGIRAACIDGVVTSPGGRREPRRDDAVHTTTYFGWGGYPLADDGYSFMGLLPSTWQAMSECGDWPYYIFWAHTGDLAILSYCEGDLALEVADSREAFRALVKATLQRHPAP